MQCYDFELLTPTQSATMPHIMTVRRIYGRTDRQTTVSCQ